MHEHIVTTVDAHVDPAREAELVAGYAELIADERQDGLLRSELLKGQDGHWRIQTTWRDIETLRAVRISGRPPAALELLEQFGAEISHSWFVVESSFSD